MRVSHLLAAATLVVVPTFATAATVNLKPIVDGAVTENGDGLVFPGAVTSVTDTVLVQQSGPLTTTAVFDSI